MDPATLSLLAPLLVNFGPALFSKLFGGDDPQQKILKATMALLSPAMRARVTEQYYQQNIASPAYSQAQSTIAAGANQTANLTAQNLAARGIGTTGTGAVLSSLTPSLIGSQTAQLRTSAHDAASKMATEEIQARISALQGTGGPSQTQKYVAAGIEGFQPYLQAFLKAKGWMGAPTVAPTVAAAR